MEFQCTLISFGKCEHKNLIKRNKFCAQKDNDCHGFFQVDVVVLPSICHSTKSASYWKYATEKIPLRHPAAPVSWFENNESWHSLNYNIVKIFFGCLSEFMHMLCMLCRSSCLGWWAGVKKEKITKIFRDRKSFQFLINENEQLPLNKHFQLLSNRFKTSLAIHYSDNFYWLVYN